MPIGVIVERIVKVDGEKESVLRERFMLGDCDKVTVVVSSHNEHGNVLRPATDLANLVGFELEVVADPSIGRAYIEECDRVERELVPPAPASTERSVVRVDKISSVPTVGGEAVGDTGSTCVSVSGEDFAKATPTGDSAKTS